MFACGGGRMRSATVWLVPPLKRKTAEIPSHQHQKPAPLSMENSMLSGEKCFSVELRGTFTFTSASASHTIAGRVCRKHRRKHFSKRDREREKRCLKSQWLFIDSVFFSCSPWRIFSQPENVFALSSRCSSKVSFFRALVQKSFARNWKTFP